MRKKMDDISQSVECKEDKKAERSTALRDLKEAITKLEKKTTSMKKILRLLREDGEKILNEEPDLFLEMVNKAPRHIASPLYLEIIQKMAEIYLTIEKRARDEPLLCLVKQMEAKYMRRLCIYQDELLSLIKMLLNVDNSTQTRTRCLRILVVKAKGVPMDGELRWTEELVATVKFLLEGGADPTWIPQDHDEESAAYHFLKGASYVLALENPRSHSIMLLLPWFLTERCLSHRESKGTILHALVEDSWYLDPEDLPGESSEYGIIRTIVESNPSIRDVTDSKGRYPLQCFIIGGIFSNHFLRTVNNVIHTLKTECNINARDEDGRTVLHMLAVAYSFGQMDHEVFLELFSSLKLASHRDIQDKDGKNVLHILAEAMLDDRVLGSELLIIFPFLTTENNVNAQDRTGKTVLHIIASRYPQISHDECLKLVSSLRSSSNVDVQDDDGQTALHILARTLYQHPELGSGLSTIFPLLATEKNVNLSHNDSTTPFSWILIAKARWGNSTKDKKLLSEIGNIFLLNKADVDLAKGPASRKPLYRWIAEELTDVDCTSARLQTLLSGTLYLTDGINLPDELSYMEELNEEVWDNLIKIGSAEFLPIVMDILQGLMANKSTAEHAWTSFMEVLSSYDTFPLHALEILCLLAERGAQPADGELQWILSQTNAVSRNEELTVAFLKTLVALRRKKHFTCNLQYLADFYIVSQEMIQLGRQLVHAVHGTMDNCLQSKELIDCFLFISHEQGNILDEKFIEHFFEENWLHRSPLHLAVIILDSESSLGGLPLNIVTKYISAKDLHGCTPLHLAYLHHNEQAVKFLIYHGAIEDATDKFGMSPKLLKNSLAEDHSFKYKEMCHSILEAKCGDQIKLMLVNPVAVQTLSDEVKMLLEHLTHGTQFEDAPIVICGSLREKLKAGCLDEADIQLRFEGKRIGDAKLLIGGNEWKDEDFLKEMSVCLIKKLAEISWDGINLRPISVHGPWKFLREGMTVSLDVVSVIAYDEELSEENREEGYVTQEEAHGLQGELLLGDYPLHRRMDYCTLESWKYKAIPVLPLRATYFAYEWDITDSLSTSCRLAIVIAKFLVQAYDVCRGDNLHVKIPITSYTIKTALFYILADDSNQNLFRDAVPWIEAMRKALDCVKGMMGEVRTSSKVIFNPKPRWLTDKDVDQHGEEAKVCATMIFTLIKCLAQHRVDDSKQGWKLVNFWDRWYPVIAIEGYGEAKYTCDVCDCALRWLSPNRDGLPIRLDRLKPKAHGGLAQKDF